jgi:hypothetical protein
MIIEKSGSKSVETRNGWHYFLNLMITLPELMSPPTGDNWGCTHPDGFYSFILKILIFFKDKNIRTSFLNILKKMKSKAVTVSEYLDSLPDERKAAMNELRKVIKKNLPDGFSEVMSYGMIGYVVPHSIYPDGYHCNPTLPLGFMNIASQKNFIAVYHMGIYADKKLLEWFTQEYPKHVKTKLDMGKSCLRFKKPEQIPFELIGQLSTKLTPQQWINVYESVLKKNT